MIIEGPENTVQYVTFASLDVGDVFKRSCLLKDFLYLKVDGRDTEVNAVNLTDDWVAKFRPFDKVVKVRAKLIVEV